MVALLQELFTVAICAAVLLGSVASDLPSLVVGLHQARRSLGAALPPHPRHGPHLLFKKEASQGASEALGGTQEQFPVLSLREAIETLQSRTDGVVLHHTRGQNQDMLVVFPDSTSHDNTSYPINPTEYAKYMTLSHLAVTPLIILLPDLLPSNFLKSNTCDSLKRLDPLVEEFANDEEVAGSIIKLVNEFVNDTVNNSCVNNTETVKDFTSNLWPHLQGAAEMAVRDYYDALNSIISNITILKNASQLSVVIAVEGFSYPGSFLELFYNNLTVRKNTTKRIVLVPQPRSTSASAALSNDTYIRTLNKLFGNDRLSPLHSLLSDAARKVLEQTQDLSFSGFRSIQERLYVILLVTFFSTTFIFVVVVLSICYEDRHMKMEDRPAKPATPKSPKNDSSASSSLLTPIPEREFASSSYSAFHRLKKKHMQSGRPGLGQGNGGPLPGGGGGSGGKYARLVSEPDSMELQSSPVSSAGGVVTHSEVAITDLSES